MNEQLVYTTGAMAVDKDTSCKPGMTAQQVEQVLETLQSITSSSFFCKSKRYTEVLEYLIKHSLEGDGNALRERVLGIEIFDRQADWDAGNDSVVRTAVLEVRKRMSLFFKENPHAPVLITLPSGSYTAEFQFRQPDLVRNDESIQLMQTAGASMTGLAVAAQSDANSEVAWAVKGRWALILVAVVVLLILGTMARGNFKTRSDAAFWAPLLFEDNVIPIIVEEIPVIPVPDFGKAAPAASELAVAPPQGDWRDENPVIFGSMVAVANTCGVLRQLGGTCKYNLASAVKLIDVHKTPLVVVGGFRGELTARFLSEMRYRIRVRKVTTADAPYGICEITDSFHPEVITTWGRAARRPPTDSGDYAILARYHSSITDGFVVILTGLGPQSTSSLGEFITSADNLNKLLAQAPKNWTGQNFEAVLQTKIVQGNAGEVKPVALYFW